MGAAASALRCVVCGQRRESAASPDISCTHCDTKLYADARGIWQPPTSGAPISYPADGNALTLRVEDDSFWFHHRNRIIAAALEQCGASGPVWDVGGGNGFQAREMQRQREVVVVEPGPEGCVNARNRGVERVICGTLQDVGLAAGSVPTMTMFDVIEHIEEPQGLLTEAHRVLRDDGHLVVTVPAFQPLWSDEDEFAGHFRRYSKATLRTELERAGFQVEMVEHLFGPLLLPIALLRALPYRLGLRKSNNSMNADEHAPGGLAQRAVDWMLAREHEAIRRHKWPRLGTSVLAVATP